MEVVPLIVEEDNRLLWSRWISRLFIRLVMFLLLVEGNMLRQHAAVAYAIVVSISYTAASEFNRSTLPDSEQVTVCLMSGCA